jgi:N-acetylmuramoyl-L-alanine amidase
MEPSELSPEDIDLLNPNFHPKFIVVHHSLTEDQKVVDWEAIRKYHTEVKGWSDIGYHFGVEFISDGYKILQGRSILRQGAQVKDFNSQSLGVCMVGNFDLNPVPHDQWQLTLQLVRKLQWFLHIPTDNVIGHREAQELLQMPLDQRKSCPGTKCDMGVFRSDLSKMV